MANALCSKKLILGNLAIAGANGALSTLMTEQPICCKTHVHPPGLLPKSKQSSLGLGLIS